MYHLYSDSFQLLQFVLEGLSKNNSLSRVDHRNKTMHTSCSSICWCWGAPAVGASCRRCTWTELKVQASGPIWRRGPRVRVPVRGARRVIFMPCSTIHTVPG